MLHAHVPQLLYGVVWLHRGSWDSLLQCHLAWEPRSCCVSHCKILWQCLWKLNVIMQMRGQFWCQLLNPSSGRQTNSPVNTHLFMLCSYDLNNILVFILGKWEMALMSSNNFGFSTEGENLQHTVWLIKYYHFSVQFASQPFPSNYILFCSQNWKEAH